MPDMMAKRIGRLSRIAVATMAAVVFVATASAGCLPSPGAEVALFASGAMKSKVARVINEDGETVRHGRFQSWHPNGRLHEEGMYVNGKMDGCWTLYDSNGRRRSQQHYIRGQRCGVWAAWHANGRLARRWQYVSDKEQGEWLTWDEAGVLIKRELYRDGEKLASP